nr:hypothetical protein [Tanacetum cinerariifolium]
STGRLGEGMGCLAGKSGKGYCLGGYKVLGLGKFGPWSLKQFAFRHDNSSSNDPLHHNDGKSHPLQDIQSVGFDTRPPMLDRFDFESCQQRIRLYCLGKENGENILQSIDEGPFKMGKFKETLANGALGPKWDRFVKDLTPKEKERFKADIYATNILLQGFELTRDERESQLYDAIEHFHQNKGENIHEYYVSQLNRGLKTSNYDQLYAYLKQHEAHANENKMMLERYTQHAIDPLAFVSNVSLQQYPTQPSTTP